VAAPLTGLLVGFLTSQAAFLATTVYLHRALSHRAITLTAPVVAVGRVVIWVATGMRPREWVAVHRRHHAFADRPGDPHSPIVSGYPMVQFANALLYRRFSRDPEMIARYARDLPADRWDRALFDRAVLGLGIGIAALVAIFGWEAGLIASGIHAVSYLLGGGAVNGIGHKWGRRPHDNLATNNQWLAWITAGEGLHNNHHAAATAGRLSRARGEVDPGWWLIQALVRLKWATVRHDQAVGRSGTPAAAGPAPPA
jgi:stearoyl-CoA desaturase (delta-9 desaturase)